MFEVIAPTDAGYEALNEFVGAQTGNFDYNGLTNAINAAAVGSLLKFKFRKGKVSHLRQQLETRGLAVGADIQINAGFEKLNPDGTPDENSAYIVVVKRLSEKTGTQVVSKPRGKQSTKGDAAAETTTAAADAKGKGKGK